MSAQEVHIVSTLFNTLNQSWDKYKEEHHSFITLKKEDLEVIENAAKKVLESVRNLKLELTNSLNRSEHIDGTTFAVLSQEAFNLFSDDNILYSLKLKKRLRKITSLFLEFNTSQSHSPQQKICPASSASQGSQVEEGVEILGENFKMFLLGLENTNKELEEAVQHMGEAFTSGRTGEALLRCLDEHYLLCEKQYKLLFIKLIDRKVTNKIDNFEQFLEKVIDYTNNIEKAERGLKSGDLQVAHNDGRLHPHTLLKIDRAAEFGNLVDFIYTTFSKIVF